jgi:hypothetical protein
MHHQIIIKIFYSKTIEGVIIKCTTNLLDFTTAALQLFDVQN